MIAQAKQLFIRLHVALRSNPYGRPIGVYGGSVSDDLLPIALGVQVIG